MGEGVQIKTAHITFHVKLHGLLFFCVDSICMEALSRFSGANESSAPTTTRILQNRGECVQVKAGKVAVPHKEKPIKVVH